jgi:MarR family transcriptional regulator for hemolysin
MNQPPPAKNLGLLIHDVGRLLRKRIDQQAQSIGLTSAQWRVVAYLARSEGSNQASLADVMELEPITLSRHLDRMEADGMIERRPDPADRRAHRLFLTDKGKRLVTAFRPEAACVIQEAVAGLTDERISGMIDLLSTMRTNLTGKTETVEPDATRAKARAKEGIAT